jgi:hypothetical protein
VYISVLHDFHCRRVQWVVFVSEISSVCVCARDVESLPSRGRVTPSSQTPPLEEEAPFQNTWKYGKNKYMVIGPNRPETKIDCADEDQLKFTLPIDRPLQTAITPNTTLIGLSCDGDRMCFL